MTNAHGPCIVRTVPEIPDDDDDDDDDESSSCCCEFLYCSLVIHPSMFARTFLVMYLAISPSSQLSLYVYILYVLCQPMSYVCLSVSKLVLHEGQCFRAREHVS